MKPHTMGRLELQEYLSSDDSDDLVCTSYVPEKAPPRLISVNPRTLEFTDAQLEECYCSFHHKVLLEVSDGKVQSLHVGIIMFYAYLHLVSFAQLSAEHTLNICAAALHAALLYGLRKYTPALFARYREYIHAGLAMLYLMLHLCTHLAGGDVLSIGYTVVLGSSCLLNLGLLVICPVMYKTQVFLSVTHTLAIMVRRNARVCHLCSAPAVVQVLDSCWAVLHSHQLPHPALNRLEGGSFVGACSCHALVALLQVVVGICLPSAVAYQVDWNRRKLFLRKNNMVLKQRLPIRAPRWVKVILLGSLLVVWATALLAAITAGVSRVVPGCLLQSAQT